MLERYVKRILQAQVYDVAIETPMSEARFLSKRMNNTILIKREDLQPVYSFKLRGAYNAMAQLTEEEKERGVVTASAGNHAQGVAMAAKQMGIKATIVMPKITPEIKVASAKARGGKVVLKGDSFDEAAVYARQLVEEKGYTYIPPYDHPEVIAGQGTIAMEMLRQHPAHIDAIFVPVGGGGLIAGIAVYVKYLRPEIKVIGVEAEDSACLKAALDAGERVILDQVGIFAEGVAVAQIGEEPFRIAQHFVDDVITVTTDEICAAVKDMFEDTRAVSEPSGALSLAGLKKYIQQTGAESQTLLCINSGANTNFDRLQHIAERAELGEKREAILAVTIPERTGSFKQFCKVIGRRMVTEFNYRYADSEQARIFVGVQLKDPDDRAELMQTLISEDYPVIDMSDNEMAKLHIRHLGGGHNSEIQNEQLFRFEFPERPGALLNFLTNLGQNWNITLFHYRNHGAAYGRVLIGMQVPEEDKEKVSEYLNRIGYRYWDETENPAYKLFLA
ncbi:L-threonine ammonia-lyase [Oceanospirillum multiglobuliferum]|uniref:L-threonine dehydratase n=1 Tax=Oceanospirillum multiglobuliferum TaxID=64969 RepID=A0A1T4SDG4_9GAMM|nr:threonine ammonia-lyase, biosynthetic [Oceanospirillum multiglobuliferum]OPX54328.1 threonine ammonia-lyase, biosynthetic [Oceanospirillum multiglobuliferum]SKA26273.1 L-threonine ammonia-lyase [Oceanospirillum multiglobuliferum]